MSLLILFARTCRLFRAFSSRRFEIKADFSSLPCFFLSLSGMAPPPAGALPPGYRGPAGQQNVRPRAPGGPPNGVALPGGGPPAIPGATSRVPPRPVAAGPRAPTGLTAASLAASSPSEQKQTLGEALYPLIAAINDPLAGKITGMLLEMDVYELLHLIETPEALLAKTNEAMGEFFPSFFCRFELVEVASFEIKSLTPCSLSSSTAVLDQWAAESGAAAAAAAAPEPTPAA